MKNFFSRLCAPARFAESCFTKKNLGRWKGRIAGSLFGILAGPFGIVFGFLIGYLVDFILASGSIRKKTTQFLASPRTVYLPGNEEGKYSFFCLGAALTIASGGSPGALRDLLFRRLADFYPLAGKDTEYLRALLEDMDSIAAAPGLEAHAREVRRLCAAQGETDSAERLRALFAGLLPLAGETSAPAQLILRCLARVWNIESGIAETPPPGEEDPWRVLGLARNAGRVEVKKVFRMLAAQFHPDGGFALSDTQRRETEEAFRRIRGAYEKILDEI